MSKWAQCGQLGAAYSTTVTGAFGLPCVLSQDVMVTPCAFASGTASAPELDWPENTNHAATPKASIATTTRRVRRGLRDTGASLFDNSALAFGRAGQAAQSAQRYSADKNGHAGGAEINRTAKAQSVPGALAVSVPACLFRWGQ